MNYVRPKKNLGQHFLKDLGIAQEIVNGLKVASYKKVLEIGPGMGVLTDILIKRDDLELFAAEVDGESVEYLTAKYPEFAKEHLIFGDFLKMKLDGIFPEKFGVIGNFPYNISSQIFFKILEHKDLVDEVVCMLQKEVAERLAEPPGTKTYGILSVLLQAYYDIEYLFTVHEHVFNPPPKVKSAVIRLTRNSVAHLDCDEKLFKQVVKATFNHRRKTIRNTVKPLVASDCPEHPLYGERPERLSVAQFVDLTNHVGQHLVQGQ
ncbi:16S rRNA (adenine(1518)-N(6)/adenine(1519)-N(6))-dimethyltransferase RsmA [uncultured Acetobacteroides sp.]|uniref:16S rRNA (adenine(1518)-N(6)/adenine(1519)-N(6))- dimethyltransferase RsmA n=1 Tax=uncultured Acetobacteroides sp. TaxID=1760811 RepID=UPI0029F51E1D|nr:16S rRNA (adenine(1518)-N(6)/adenine(1519)-N(6))-dimethyltransferase RsmA [uncultured Acetobacteroides sp.]